MKAQETLKSIVVKPKHFDSALELYLELRRANDKSRRRCKANGDRQRDEVNQSAELEERHEKLNDAGEKAEKHSQVWSRDSTFSSMTTCHQSQESCGSDRDFPTPAEKRIDDAADESRVESILRFKASEC